MAADTIIVMHNIAGNYGDNMKKPRAARALTSELLQQQFGLIIDAALANERCPTVEPYGPMIQSALRKMQALGWIDWEIGYRGWRMVTILHGPHIYKTTAANPRAPAPKVWGPSAPRPLTREELER